MVSESVHQHETFRKEGFEITIGRSAKLSCACQSFNLSVSVGFLLFELVLKL